MDSRDPPPPQPQPQPQPHPQSSPMMMPTAPSYPSMMAPATARFPFNTNPPPPPPPRPRPSFQRRRHATVDAAPKPRALPPTLPRRREADPEVLPDGNIARASPQARPSPGPTHAAPSSSAKPLAKKHRGRPLAPGRSRWTPSNRWNWFHSSCYLSRSRRVQDGPAAPRKRIENRLDSFMHAPLGSGDIARLVELRSCNWVVAITGWMSNCPGERRGGRMGAGRSSMDRTWTVVGVGGSPRVSSFGILGKRIKLALANA
ncbi:hypothetical protein Fmac_025430 [Flemingia macrophylla]|uniref:Uncharacterized protein n=1 Tax=Flemingia macrophylla TaxID=520843 RepID=A0ABD1LS66_9FABA